MSQRSWRIGAVIWLLAGAAVNAQSKPDVVTKENETLVTVRGCVVGSHFKPSLDTLIDLPAYFLDASDYKLEGKRELLQRFRKDHDGHFEEVTGTVKRPPEADQPDVRIKSVEVTKKTRVTIGQAKGSGYSSAPLTVTINVQSLKHLNDRCAIK